MLILEDLEALGLEAKKNSGKDQKNFTLENENLNKNISSNDFRIRPQSSMPRFLKK